MIAIRHSEDTSAIAALDRRIFPSDEAVDVDGARWWIAYDGAEPIGYGGVASHAVTPRTAYLRRAGLLAAYRGQGIGSRLTAARLRWCRRHFAEVVTYTTHSNFASMRALIGAGFVPHAPRWAYAGDVFLYWRCDLEAS